MPIALNTMPPALHNLDWISFLVVCGFVTSVLKTNS